MYFMRMANRIIRGLWYLPKTVYVNFVSFSLSDAIKFPIIVMGKTRFSGLRKGAIVIEAPLKRGMIKISAQKSAKSGVAVNSVSKYVFRNNGKILFEGSASLGAGTSVCSSGEGIVFGDGFSCNVNCFISSCTSISFGKDVLLGWNVNVRDDDGHPIYDLAGMEINTAASVKIANHVWIASYVDILKGVFIAEGNIVGYRSLVTKSVMEENCICAGTPIRIVKKNIRWEHN